MIILIAIPLLLRTVGIFCEKSGKRLLYCIAVSLAVFIVCGLPALSGFYDSDYFLFGTDIKNIPFDKLGELHAPPAKLILMKLCAFFSDEPTVYPIVTAFINSLLAGYAVRRAPYHSSAVLFFIFIPAFFFRSGTLTAALICTGASVYVREHRFFRYAALVLMAACFDMSALLTLPFYFVTLIPGALFPASAAAVIAALAVIFSEALGGVYEAIFAAGSTTCDTPVFCAVTAVLAALVCMLMYAMFRNREGGYQRLVPLLCCGAALTVASVFDARLYAAAIILLMQSAVPIADEAYTIGSKFVGILFKEFNRTARKAFFVVCAASGAILCVCLVLTDAFGVSQYDVAVKAVFGL